MLCSKQHNKHKHQLQVVYLLHNPATLNNLVIKHSRTLDQVVCPHQEACLCPLRVEM